MQNSYAKPSIAHRTGHLIGSAISRYLKWDARLIQRLVGAGAPATLCCWISRGVKIGAIGLLLYLSFWIAIVAAGLWILQGMAEKGLIPDSAPDDDDGWQNGLSGFGYYCNGYRVDSGRDEDE